MRKRLGQSVEEKIQSPDKQLHQDTGRGLQAAGEECHKKRVAVRSKGRLYNEIHGCEMVPHWQPRLNNACEAPGVSGKRVFWQERVCFESAAFGTTLATRRVAWDLWI